MMIAKKLLFVAGIALNAVPALAAPAPVTLTTEAHVERPTMVDGALKLVPVASAGHLSPGDHITFVFAYKNVSAKPIEHFVPSDPLPAGIVLALSPEPTGDYQVSVDGGHEWGSLASAMVADGKGGRRHAEATDVSHIRWMVPVIAPGAGGSVEFHALVR